MWRVGAILAGVGLAGCCTLRGGRDQVIPVVSSPAGAVVTVQPGGDTFRTPGTVVLPRTRAAVLRLEAPGVLPATVVLESHARAALWRNLVWIHPVAIAAGVLIDVSTGAGYALAPEAVAVTLAPAP